MNVKNLDKLAAYLEGLPSNYSHFHMSYFVSGMDGFLNSYQHCEVPLANECGTVACALGHGPAAGICFTPDDNRSWWQYAFNHYTDGDMDLWNWLFSDRWYSVDNTHQGAAARIRYVLAGNKIDDGFAIPSEFDVDNYAEYLK
jgi:hypothetical protein